MKRRFFDALEGTVNFCFLGEKFCWHPILPDPARPLRRALRPDPPVICPGFGFDNKYELDCSCFRRDVQDSVLDSLEGKREGCLRAGSTQRRPVLPSPAPLCRPAVRRPDPTGPWCVRVLDSTIVFTWDFDCSCFWRDAQATFLRFLGGYTGLVFAGRAFLLARNPARSRPADPPFRRAPRTARGMSGFWIRQVNKLYDE